MSYADNWREIDKSYGATECFSDSVIVVTRAAVNTLIYLI